MPRDSYCGACGAPLTGGRRRSAFSGAADDILPLRVPDPPRTGSRRAARVVASALSIGLVLILGIGALAVAMNQLNRGDEPTTAVSGLHRFGADISTGGDNAITTVAPMAELVQGAVPAQLHTRAAGQPRISTHQPRGDVAGHVDQGRVHARAAGQLRVGTHQASVETPAVFVVADVPEVHIRVIDLGARDVALSATSGQMAIAKAPMTRSHPGDGTGGVMVIASGDGTGGVSFLSAP